MGRIGTTLIKRTGSDLFNQYSDRFSTDFNANKKIVGDLRDFYSRKLRNLVTGMVTRLKKRQEKQK